MIRGRVKGWTAFLMVAMAALPTVAAAGQKLAVFPIDMSVPRTEEDFFRGVTGPSEAEKKRLELAHAELVKRLTTDGSYEIADLSALTDEIAAAAPIHECNGCEMDLATKANADLVMVSVLDKISETHLSLTVSIVDVAERRMLNKSTVLIQGNTDESWLHGVRWLMKNRLLAEETTK